jgi:hypothetical protein
MVKLVEQQYGPEKITPNMHLCLHICECALDYGPLYSFWCYGFERMNGLLGKYNLIPIFFIMIIFLIFNIFIGSFHSSNRHIEPELLRIVQHYSILDELSASYGNENQHLSTCLPYIAFKESVGSLAAHEDFDLIQYFEFLSMSKNVKDKAGIGSEPFPGAFMKPMKKDTNLRSEVLALLVEYYSNAYQRPFVALSNVHASSKEAIVVLPKVNQYSRLRIGAEVFGSISSPRYIKSANVLSQFILDDNNTTDIYPGQVQFFFEHTIYLSEGPVTHSLAFVRWYSAADDRRSRFHCQIDKDNTKISNIELWKKDFYELSRDCIIPVHNILGRFVAGTMKIGKKTPKEFTAVIPINKKIHI